jgi:hypothetical protein
MNTANRMNWLQVFLDEAAAQRLCVVYGCTTCGSQEFIRKLLRAVRAASGLDLTARGWTDRTLRFLADGLAKLPAISQQDKPAVRTIIMHLYKFDGDGAFEDNFAPGFQAGPAGEILRSMRKHFAARQAAKQAHLERNDPKAIEARRMQKRADGLLRQAQRRAKYMQDSASARSFAKGENIKVGSSEHEVIIAGDMISAYEATEYSVEAPGGKMILRIGQPFIGFGGMPRLNRIAVITAYNPFSLALDDVQNAERQVQLINVVERAGLSWFHASGADAAGEWPPEPSLAIVDPTDKQLDCWMEAFEQNAVVVADVGEMAKLRLHPRHKSNHKGALGEVAQVPTSQTMES